MTPLNLQLRIERLEREKAELLGALKRILENAGFTSGKAEPTLKELRVSIFALHSANAAIAKAETLYPRGKIMRVCEHCGSFNLDWVGHSKRVANLTAGTRDVQQCQDCGRAWYYAKTGRRMSTRAYRAWRKPCQTCGGAGKVAIEEGAPDVVVATMPCPDCHETICLEG